MIVFISHTPWNFRLWMVMTDFICPDKSSLSLETILQIYRDQSGLPVMAVNDIRLESNDRERR